MVARWLFLAGAAALLGAATASVASFGGDGDIAVATTGWAIASLGIVLLGDAQRHTAATTVGELLGTSIGHALLWRAAALAAAAVALIAARTPSRRRGAMVLVAVFVLASIAVHAAAGHAAAIEGYPVAAIGLQSLHIAAAGVWFGGLAALLAGTRGQPDAGKTAAVRRYSSLAGVALAIVGATGILRTVQELSSWQQLIATDYGQAALAKGLLLMAIAAFGALNRWRSVPLASTDLRPLRRFAFVELTLMTVALAVAAILATLPPPR
jgi:putative copper export protein